MNDDYKLRIITQTTASLIKFLPLDIINLIVTQLFNTQSPPIIPSRVNYPNRNHNYAIFSSFTTNNILTTETYISIHGSFVDYRDVMEYVSSIKTPIANLLIVDTNSFVKIPFSK